MSGNSGKQLSNPFSTGGGGAHFEAHVQAAFVVMMLAGGYVPCLPCTVVKKIQLQGKHLGYQTDDLIVSVKDFNGNGECKLLGQIKHAIRMTESDSTFAEVIQAAWGDFNNSALFKKGKDVIALITGPLSATDTSDVRTLLERARHSENSAEFFRDVELTNFSSDAKRAKLKAFKAKLKVANKNTDVAEEEVYEFLRHFHLLGYDLDIRSGVTLALLHSLIGPYSAGDPQSIWAKIVDVVQSTNQNAGPITMDTIPEDLRTSFQHRRVVSIPDKFTISDITTPPKVVGTQPEIVALILATLVGSWDEKNGSDVEIVKGLAHNFETIDITLREMIQSPESSVRLEGGRRWVVMDREKVFQAISGRIFDQQLELLKRIAIAVLSEVDPSFDLPPSERWAAALKGANPRYSKYLRKGLVEALTWLGVNCKSLTNCSAAQREFIVPLVIRELFSNADWRLWGSLNDFLPSLAEAAPGEFLNAVEQALQKEPCPFDGLFAQENSGVTGRNYMTGLLWALEVLAWSEEHLVRVCVVLAELAAHDPGGNWGNRPANSITNILLPWYPQTLAPVEKRISSIRAIRSDFPDIAWKTILSLLPQSHQTTVGTYKPRWQTIVSADWTPTVTDEEYREQIETYAALAVEMAREDMEKLTVLVGYLDKLTPSSFNAVLDLISSDVIVGLSEIERMHIWSTLSGFARKHRRYSGAVWALPESFVCRLEVAAEKLAPTSVEVRYRWLFSNRDFDLYEENDNWEEQRKKLESRREEAIREILKKHGVEGVISFLDNVEAPYPVGWALGKVADAGFDVYLLPAYLVPLRETLQQFIRGYIGSCYQSTGWKWVDGLNRVNWSPEQLSRFLMGLPFVPDTWSRVRDWLGDSENLYWREVQVSPYQAEDNILYAVDKLLGVDRPQPAVDCLYFRNHNHFPLDSARTIKALSAVPTLDEAIKRVDSYHVVELIKALQDDPCVDSDELAGIEWVYLSFLEHREYSPKRLEDKLAKDPNFFCEAVRFLYRSTHEEKKDDKPSEDTTAMASNAWHLLNQWKLMPGVQKDGGFLFDEFKDWLSKVKKSCQESGHFDVAMSHVGHVLLFCPKDPNGLWIVESVARELNAKDSEKMRDGYRLAVFNSRGAHWVDPTGKPEKDLAELWRQRAEAVEKLGFVRFATSLKILVETYQREAERVIAEHKSEGVRE